MQPEESDTRSRVYYDADAAQYYDTRFTDPIGARVATRTQQLIAELLDDLTIDRAIEVGPGTGRITVEIAARAAQLMLVDISPTMLSMSLRPAQTVARGPVSAVVGSLHRLPCRSASHDLAVCINVLSHVPDAEAAVRELGRVVRPGGRLLLSSTNLTSAFMPAGLIVNARQRAFGEDVPARWHRRRDLIRYLERSGFRIDAIVGGFYLPRAARAVPGLGRLMLWADEREHRRPPGLSRSLAPWLLYSCEKRR